MSELGGPHTTTYEWPVVGQSVCAHRHRVYDGVWHTSADKFCPWRYIYGRSLLRILFCGDFSSSMVFVCPSGHRTHCTGRHVRREDSLPPSQKCPENFCPHNGPWRVVFYREFGPRNRRCSPKGLCKARNHGESRKDRACSRFCCLNMGAHIERPPSLGFDVCDLSD